MSNHDFSPEDWKAEAYSTEETTVADGQEAKDEAAEAAIRESREPEEFDCADGMSPQPMGKERG